MIDDLDEPETNAGLAMVESEEEKRQRTIERLAAREFGLYLARRFPMQCAFLRLGVDELVDEWDARL